MQFYAYLHDTEVCHSQRLTNAVNTWGTQTYGEGLGPPQPPPAGYGAVGYSAKLSEDMTALYG